MGRTPKHSDDEVDANISDFIAAKARMRSYPEVKAMLPHGISNDRIAAARARATSAQRLNRGGHDAGASALSAMKTLASGLDAAILEIAAAHEKERRRLQHENDRLRTELKRVEELRVADSKATAANVRQDIRKQLEATTWGALQVQLDKVFASES